MSRVQQCADSPLRVVIVGGGTAGLMTAAALTALAGRTCAVTLIEAADIPIIGVGEATLPHLRAFVARLGIDETAFMAATSATFKLGIRFSGFGARDSDYFHPFGDYGPDFGRAEFHHYWLRRHAAGDAAPLGDYGIADMAAAANRFARPEDMQWSGEHDTAGLPYGYAYQFDATRFAPFLRDWTCARGAQRREAQVTRVVRSSENGRVLALEIADGQRVSGDLFIDCSGFRAILRDEDLWEDWSHWLPCDRAVAVPCTAAGATIEPYTRAKAMDAGGWRWRIPLQHRVGNGYVYPSAFVGDDHAQDTLLAALEGAPLADPRVLRFRAGRQRRAWAHNVVAIGLAAGFLEPLESTSIHLVQAAITHLIEHFPDAQGCDADRDGFNRAMDAEHDRIRDFLILHYHATIRDDAPFWTHVRTMAVPDTLAATLELWRETAQVARYGFGLFKPPSWVAVLIGQGMIPRRWDQRADAAPADMLARELAGLRASIADRVAALPNHSATLARVAASSA
ncbi:MULTISPECIES: tryptophan halogenase family protein [Sphingomonas]|uniref:Tryptophan halogenase family protein n=1 Tax=Sphingomonas molluscorum TaxID=418184 RepID=A0ABU8Q8M8_9SPHN|nr:tryptophan halogenase family protein [Sphingomonas sp. JUb134]